MAKMLFNECHRISTRLFIIVVLYIQFLNSICQKDAINYGVDISFPTHHGSVSTNYAWLPHNVDPDNNPVPEEFKDMPIQPLPDRQKVYEDYMKGCERAHSKKYCIGYDNRRLRKGINRVKLMKNFTTNGFHKTRLPSNLFSRIDKFWQTNRHKTSPESNNPFINHWDNQPLMVDFENDTMEWNHDNFLKSKIYQTTRDMLEEWTGLELKEAALYGIRVYRTGAILSTHVDDLPRVISAIINVDQDVDEEWPLEVIGHDGRAYNVTMSPGDIVFYESHSCYHGRPFSLIGNYFANIFVHFQPTGYTAKDRAYIEPSIENAPIFITGGEWVVKNGHKWTLHPNAEGDQLKKNSITYESVNNKDTGATEAHAHAYHGHIDKLKEIASNNPSQLHKRDKNGWQPIHEAARSGNKHVVDYLIENGADVNSLTTENGGSVLYWALQSHDGQSEFIKYLESIGAQSIHPEL